MKHRAIHLLRYNFFLMFFFVKHESQAYLQQELEKLHDLRNKVKLEGEHWDDLVSSSSQNSHLVSKATRLWESILARKSEYKLLWSFINLLGFYVLSNNVT